GFYNNQFGTVGVSKTVILGSEATPESTDSFDSGQAIFPEGTRMTEKDILEITTMRKEGVYEDSRHPIEVSWTKSIEEDLARRDFTINSMAFTLIPSPFTLVDPFDGQKDLAKKI